MSQAKAQMEPGLMFYMVWMPSTVLAPNGDPQFQMVGPFPDLGTATQYAAPKMGALIVLNSILYKTTVPMQPAATLTGATK